MPANDKPVMFATATQLRSRRLHDGSTRSEVWCVPGDETARQLHLWRQAMGDPNRHPETVEVKFSFQIGRHRWSGPYVPKQVIAVLLGKKKRLGPRRRANPYARDRVRLPRT